jgi:hemerythrin-like domain-containing protein
MPVAPTPPRAKWLSSSRRFDLYAPIHKALRLYMSETLARLGRMDVDDAVERQATLSQTQALLSLLRSHLRHENDFVHPVIEACRPGDAQRIAGEHDEHVATICALQDMIDDLLAATPDARSSLAQALYRQLALFVAHNLEHMDDEETALNQLLWSVCTDDELRAIDQHIQAQIPAHDMAVWLRWIAASASTPDLTQMLVGIRDAAPADAFADVLSIVRPQLDAPRRQRIDLALGLSELRHD